MMRQGAGAFEAADIIAEDKLAIRFLYNTIPGRVLLRILIKSTVSKLAGSILKSPASRVFIGGFIKRNNIDMEEYGARKYRSFNDFFIRKIRKEFREFPENECDLASPCDSKLSAYPIAAGSVFHVKNSDYSVEDLLQDKELSAGYTDGACLIFRLSPDDYHRYSYIDDGEIVRYRRIDGKLHTVRPIAQYQCNVFCRNTREYAVIQTRNFGKIVQMEVGALFVGRITNQRQSGAVTRGSEKGMFEFGGSTVIMLFQKDMVKLDEAIFENTRLNKETVVRLGDKIGEKSGGAP